MPADTLPTAPALPPGQHWASALADIEHGSAFAGAARHRALLRHLVLRAQAGDTASLKETVIAVELFGRPAASFDPRLDSIVRVEARRLRQRLASHYATQGQLADWRIELPVGSYVPQLAQRRLPSQALAATRQARDLVERGEHFLRQALSRATLDQAVLRFDQALRESPEHVPALVGLGRAWFNLASAWHVPPAVAMAHAQEALEQALALDGNQAVALTLMGAIAHQHDHDWPSARRHFERALALAPAQGFVHSAYGWHLVQRGRFAEAEQRLSCARQLDPHYINSRNHMANLRIVQGRLDDAQAEVQAMQDIAPATMAIVGLRAAIAMFRGDAASAVGLYRQVCAAAPEVAACRITLASALALAGQAQQADELVAQTLADVDPALLSPYVLAIFHARRGQPDPAFDLLQRALRERDPFATQIPWDPSFASLHADARWAALLASPVFSG